MGGKESQSKLILQHIFRFIMCKKNIYIYKKASAIVIIIFGLLCFFLTKYMLVNICKYELNMYYFTRFCHIKHHQWDSWVSHPSW